MNTNQITLADLPFFEPLLDMAPPCHSSARACVEFDEFEQAVLSDAVTCVLDELPDLLWAWPRLASSAQSRAIRMLEAVEQKYHLCADPESRRSLFKLILSKWGLSGYRRALMNGFLAQYTPRRLSDDTE